jgi:hypothetical protein
METKNILEGTLAHGEQLINSDLFEDIENLISKNPFAERINYLLLNQNLATNPVRNLRDEISAPNCIGTTFFIAGLSVLGYPYHAYENELSPHMKEENKREIFDLFNPHLERKVPGAFAFSYSAEAEGWHTGIYLGEIKGMDLAFSQHGHGAKFGPESLRMYASPKFYLPKNLNIN